jgi:hypothetical protein
MVTAWAVMGVKNLGISSQEQPAFDTEFLRFDPQIPHQTLQARRLCLTSTTSACCVQRNIPVPSVIKLIQAPDPADLRLFAESK